VTTPRRLQWRADQPEIQDQSRQISASHGANTDCVRAPSMRLKAQINQQKRAVQFVPVQCAYLLQVA
jgi:hypothetical protein